MILVLLRKCKTCGITKPHDQFHKNKKYKDNIRPHCKTCRRDYENVSYHKHKHKRPYSYEKDKDTKLRRTYGISYQEYLYMLETQNGCCAICGTNDPSPRKAFSVDHCHTTGKVRSLLCGNCNTGIGLLQEDEEVMKRAIEYIVFHKNNTGQG